jgi:transposase
MFGRFPLLGTTQFPRAIVTTVTNARDFNNGRQMAVRLSLVPKQLGSGGKTSLGKITKGGDAYLEDYYAKRLVLRSCLQFEKRPSVEDTGRHLVPRKAHGGHTMFPIS